MVAVAEATSSVAVVVIAVAEAAAKGVAASAVAVAVAVTAALTAVAEATASAVAAPVAAAAAAATLSEQATIPKGPKEPATPALLSTCHQYFAQVGLCLQLHNEASFVHSTAGDKQPGRTDR